MSLVSSLFSFFFAVAIVMYLSIKLLLIQQSKLDAHGAAPPLFQFSIFSGFARFRTKEVRITSEVYSKIKVRASCQTDSIAHLHRLCQDRAVPYRQTETDIGSYNYRYSLEYGLKDGMNIKCVCRSTMHN